MQEQVYFNGTMLPAVEARLSAFDAGLSHGAGLFETLRAYQGRPLRLDAHLARMRRSAEKLSIAMPWSDGQITHGVQLVLQANELRDARLRITVTPGDLRRAGDDAAAAATVLIAGQTIETYPAEYYQRGMTVCISSFRQHRDDPLAGHKTVSYFSRLLGLREAQQKRCGEALWFTTGNHLAEGCISNVFLVRDDRLLTPPLDTPALAGIARAMVIECAAAGRVPVDEKELTIDDLLGADEVFLTNSIMEVMPVCRIERHAVGNEKVGELTRRMHEAYRDLVWKECGLDEAQAST